MEALHSLECTPFTLRYQPSLLAFIVEPYQVKFHPRINSVSHIGLRTLDWNFPGDLTVEQGRLQFEVEEGSQLI